MENRDLDQAVQVLARAMLPLPLHRAVFGGADQAAAAAIGRMFTELLENLPGVVWTIRREGRIVGVCRMKSCQGRAIPEDEPSRDDPVAVWRRAWSRHDPREAHWHLGPVGVLPQYQKQGLGSALLARFCQEVDACRAPAYLETDRDSSVRLYRKFGFEVRAEEDIMGVGNFFMWRPAAPLSSGS